MKIIDERKASVLFSKIKSGDCFFFNGELMMKIFSTHSYDNAISLVDGACRYFSSIEEVTPVDVEIYICG